MAGAKLLKKVRRNIKDYGLRIALTKGAASLIKPFYENKTYRVYVIDLASLPDPHVTDDNFTFQIINGDDSQYISQIESMEEWLQDRMAKKIENGALCLVALDNDTVAGFNIVSLKEGHLPLVHYRRKMRPHEAWSEQITVKPDYRGKRLASTLRAKMFELLRERGVRKFYGGAQVSNIASLKLARKVGFVEIADMHYRRIFTQENLQCRRYRA